MRRLSTAIGAAVVVALGVCAHFGGTAGAAGPKPTKDTPSVEVVKISGLLDPIVADFLDRTVTEAESDHAVALVLLVNSTGSVVSDDRLVRLADTLHSASVPVVAWVGPSGARAEGGMAQLLVTADRVGIAPGGAIGRMGDEVLPRRLWSDAFWQHRHPLRAGTMNADAAADAGLTVPTKDALVLRRMLLEVPGFRSQASESQPATPVQFAQLSTGKNLMHTFASPAVAELLVLIGLALLLFEFFTAGIGVAGVVGALTLVYGLYGLAVLGARPIAVVALVVAMVAFAVDVQIGVPRAWTAIGTVVFAAGYLTLYPSVPTPWPATIGGIIGVVVFMVFGMPAMTRSRFSSPAIGRGWLVGHSGTVVEASGGDGVVRVAGGEWAARSADGLEVGTAVEVTGVDGVVCQVAPTSGPGSTAGDSGS